MTGAYCSQCGAGTGADARFCPECGAAVDVQAGAGQQAGAMPAGPETGAAEPRGSRRWLGRRGLLIALPVVAVLAGAAIAASLVLGNAPEDYAIELVPADAAFYATVHLNPSLGQKRAAKGALDRAREAGVEDATLDSLEDAIEELVENATPVEYSRDVEPQIGDQVALYVRAAPDDDATLLVSTTDPQASLETMRRALAGEFSSDYYRIVQDSHRGQPYEHVVYDDGDGAPSGPAAFTIVDGFVVFGTEESVRASIDARAGDSLGASERFTSARGELSDDVLAVAYFDAAPLADAASADEYSSADAVTALEQLAGSGAIAATLTARDERFAVDLIAPARREDAQALRDPSALLETLPGDAVAAISFGDLSGPLRATLDDRASEIGDGLRDTLDELAELDADSDLASWLGQVAIYVAGDDPDSVQGAIVAETRSPADSDRALSQIESYNASDDDYYDYGASVYESPDGLGFDVVEGDEVLQVRGDEDRVIAGMSASGFSANRALDAEGGFGESNVYRRATTALGGYEPFLVIDAPPLQSLVEQAAGASDDDTYMENVRPWLSSIATVAGGVAGDDERVHIRLVAEVRR